MGKSSKRKADWIESLIIFGGIFFGFLLVMVLVMADSVPMRNTDPLVKLKTLALATPLSDTGYYPTTLPPHTYDETARRLKLAAFRLNLKVDFGTLDEGVLGEIKYWDREIHIASYLDDDARTQTLAHELAHALEPASMRDDPKESEVWAESVAYLILRKEHDDPYTHARYIARFKTHLSVLDVYRREMEYAVSALVGD